MSIERRGPTPDRMTGAEHEKDTFGTVRLRKQFMSGDRGVEYLPYDEAIRFVKERIEQDPENPSGEFANDLRLELIDMIEAELNGNGKLEVFATNGTPIDRFHGVDAFVEYTEEGRRGIARATLDVTVNTAKGDEYKADVVFEAPPEPDSEEYLPYVADVARRVLEILKPQVESMRTSQGQGSTRAWRRDQSDNGQGLTMAAK